ncbi:MAG: methyltransferase [Deltaproteobacteria bacterium]|nr:methyltransferase [Deltaproteobacteria bacterium]MBU54192.1 methyltransferase [Deltaproteobacteria bacterium]
MNEVLLKDNVQAPVTYTVRGTEKPVASTTGPGGRLREWKGEYETHTVEFYDGRSVVDTLSLDDDGFRLVNAPTKVEDFWQPSQIEEVYYKEVEALIKQETGAQEVLVFDHTLRSGNEDKQEGHFARKPVVVSHNDYTAWSGPQRVRDLYTEEEAEARLKKRFSIIQVWRPISGPVVSWPLAFCHPSKVEDRDLIASERRHPNRVGEIYMLAHNPNHQWLYFPHMTTDEALVFRCYESMEDGRVRFTPHTSFDDPTTPKDAPPRESIEIRAFAFFS